MFYVTPSGLMLLDGASGVQVSLGKGDSIHVSGEACFYRIRSLSGEAAIYRTEGSVASNQMIGAFTRPGSTRSGEVVPIGGLGDELVFQGNGGSLFITDTPNQLIVDLGPLSKIEVGRKGVEVNGSLLFSASRTGLLAMWRTDGTRQGTGMLLAPRSSQVARLNSGTAIFRGSDSNGIEPWLSDGTLAGTRLLADLVPPVPGATMSSRPTLRGRLGDAAVFTTAVPARFWRSDGTVSGTQSFSDLTSLSPFRFTFADEWFLYYALGFGPQNSQQTWVSDGTTAGTRELQLAGNAWIRGTGASVDGKRIIFGAGPSGQDVDPWISDGTQAGTSRILDLYPGEGAGSYVFRSVAGRVVFVTTRATSVVLHGTDGSAAGTKFIREWQGGWPNPAVVDPLLSHGDRLFFGAGREDSRSVFVTDGTASGTAQLPFADAGEALSGELVRVGEEVVFATYDGVGTRIYKSDGTAAGTRSLLEFDGSLLFIAGIDDGHFLFVTEDGELWSADASDGRRVLVGQLPSSYLMREPLLITQESGATGLVFLVTSAGISGNELWSTDGTPAGTGPVGVPWSAIAWGYPSVTSLRVGSQVFFTADDGVHGLEVHTAPVSFFDDYVAETYGRGCGNEPVIALAGEARASSAVDFDIVASQATPGAPAILGWSFDRGFARNANGCTYALGGAVNLLVTSTDASGEASIAFTPSPALIDLKVDFQYGVFESDGSVSLSKGLEVVIGP